MTDFEILEKIVNKKLEITPRVEKELAFLKQAPPFLCKSFLQAYQSIHLNGAKPQNLNECHSLIAYQLGLTTLDPGNVSIHVPVKPTDLPDIDTDFAYPDAVKEYIRNKYGKDYVVGIPTYGRYRFKALLKDLARVVKDKDGQEIVSFEEVNELNKKLSLKIDSKVATDIAEHVHDEDDIEAEQDELLFSDPEIQKFQKLYPEIFEHFSRLYALPKFRSQHAAGTIILSKPAQETIPLTLSKKSICAEFIEGQGVNELSSIGVIKVDILGLKTLKMLDECNNLIMSRYNIDENTPSPCDCQKQNIPCYSNYKIPLLTRKATGEKIIDFNKLCLNIPSVYKNIGNNKTEGVFQFEPDGISAFTKHYSPREFYDLALITSLYRPGPLDARLDEFGIPLDPEDPKFRTAQSAAMVFIERVNKRLPVTYASPKLESVLNQTYGIAVYQEDLSRIIMAMTNCTFAEAEKLRKWLTKVKPEKLKSDPDTMAALEKHEQNFIENSVKNGSTQKEANAVWNLIVPFARYGFNKAHAIAYSLLSFQTGFCRTLFPLEWFTSLINHNIDKTEKIVEYIRAAQNIGYKVLKPDINKSGVNFTITEDGEILAGLTLTKGVGDKAAQFIVNNRNEQGDFISLEDFLNRKIKWQTVKIDVLQALAKTGAFDSISPNRKLTLAKILLAKKKAIIKDVGYDIKTVFAIEPNPNYNKEDKNSSKTIEIPIGSVGEIDGEQIILTEDWPEKDKTALERELFGFFIEDYLTKHKKAILKYKKTLHQIAAQKRKADTIGSIDELKEGTQKNGQKFARLSVTNIDGVRENWMIFGNVWPVYKDTIKIFEGYFALGKRDERGTFIVEAIKPLGEIIDLSTTSLDNDS